MKTRKFLISFALVLMLAVVMSVVVLAAPTIEVSSGSVKRDQTVDITVSLVDNPGVVMFTINVDYDTDYVELVGVQDAGILGKTMHVLPSPTVPGADPYILSWDNSTAPANFTDNGVIATLTFRAKSEAEFDIPTAVNVTYKNANIVNYDLTPVSFDVSAGEVTVIDGDPQPITAEDIPVKTYGDAAFDWVVTPNATSGLSNFQYSSSNEAVATIDATGEITIVGAGTTDITALEPGDATYGKATVKKTLVVNPKELTVENLTAISKVFDGTADITGLTLAGDLVGVVGNDVVIATFPTTAAFADALAGEDKAVTLSDITIDNTNYTLTQPTVTGTITKKNITVATLDLVSDPKTATFGANDIVTGYEDVEVDFANLIYNNVNGTTADVKVALKGTDAANYDAAVFTGATLPAQLVLYTVNVTADKCTVTGVTDGDKVAAGTVLTLTATADAGYKKFAGWEITGATVDSRYDIDEDTTIEITVTADTTIEVSFKKNSGFYTVAFDSNGGSAIAAQSVSAYNKAGEPKAPTKDGYTFDGWYVDAALTAKYNFDNIVTTSFTLYAKWVEGEAPAVTPDEETPGEETPGEETPETSEKFNDVAEDFWAYEAIEFVRVNGIAGGKGDGKYAPNDTVTRAEFITMLCRAYKIEPITEGDNFADAGNTWYTGYLAAAKQLGLSAGIGDNNFGPELEITREQMIQFIYNYHKSIEIDVTAEDAGFADAADIADYHKDAVNYAKKSGIINGKGDNMFDPKGNATRAELAQIFYNIFKDAE